MFAFRNGDGKCVGIKHITAELCPDTVLTGMLHAKRRHIERCRDLISRRNLDSSDLAAVRLFRRQRDLFIGIITHIRHQIVYTFFGVGRCQIEDHIRRLPAEDQRRRHDGNAIDPIHCTPS